MRTRPRPRQTVALGIVLGLVLAAGEARAQRGVDAELFHPALDGYGIFQVDRAETAHAWDFGFKLFANFAGNPLRARMSDPSDPMHARAVDTLLMDRQVALNLGVSLG